MYEARVASALPRRKPVAPHETRSAPLLTAALDLTAALLLAVALLPTGCASPGAGLLGSMSLGLAPSQPMPASEVEVGEAFAAAAPAAAEVAPAEAAQRWVTLSRAGREAMRPGHYEEAEKRFLAALAALDTQSPGDARLRATLGNLVRLAAIYQRLEREGDARRLLSAVSDHSESRGGPRLRGGVSYDSRYRDLVGQPLPRAFGGLALASGVSKKKLDALIARTARSYRVDPALVKAVVAAESNFEPLAVSKAGAQGLMQLMPETAEEMGVLAPFRPSDNLRGGVRYLRQMLDRYGDLGHALAAYNAGPNAVDHYGGIPPYRETRDYVERVMNFYRGYQNQFTP